MSLDVEIIELRTIEDLQKQPIDGLMLLGGESTVMRLRGNDEASRLLPALFAWMREDEFDPF